MRILLIGEYSNVHWTLAEGLRQLGHEVTVVSDGDSWKNYPRDIDLRRKSVGRWDTLMYLLKVLRTLRHLRGYDVVQVINPIFFDFKAKMMKPFYEILRRQNGRFYLGSFGMDHYWVKTCLDCKTFRYSDFNIGDRQRTEEPFNQEFMEKWLSPGYTELNVQMARECDGIVTGLYEYDCCYRPHFPDKTTYIPFPIDLSSVSQVSLWQPGEPVRFFVGIQRGRSEYKGTDVMLRALRRVEALYPTRCEVQVAESVPYAEYERMVSSSHVLLDQLYSYTPGMNGLMAMAKGMVLVGGGEEENYEILGEKELRPIVNVLPDEEDVFRKLEDLVLHPEQIARRQQESVAYISRYHNHVKVARQYEEKFLNSNF